VPPPVAPWHRRIRDSFHDYFYGESPTVTVALVPMCFLSMVLFTRHPFRTNFIFDEQEALLANPYVRSVADPTSPIRWLDAFKRDFWGLLPSRTIGSYRPLPNLVWRALWGLGAREASPFLHHWVNVLLHGLNGALLVVLVATWTRNRTMGWLAGAFFVTCAVVTEAVSGVVGIADVMGALGALLALWALSLPFWAMPFFVFAGVLFGLYSKESGLSAVPLVPLAALLTAQVVHPQRPWRWFRATLALIASAGAFVLYVELRRRMFPAQLPAEISVAAVADKPPLARAFAALLRWYAQPTLPRDPLNNPLVDVAAPYRIAGALEMYAKGLVQVFYPKTLSADYSAQQEVAPTTLRSLHAIGGALAMALPFVVAPWLAIRAYRERDRSRASQSPEPTGSLPETTDLRPRPSFTSHDAFPLSNVRTPEPQVDVRPVVAFALLWVVLAFFPVSNIPVLLPTIRAERFWYLPAIGTSILLAVLFGRAFDWSRPKRLRVLVLLPLLALVGFHGYAARRHANDYSDDLSFWRATRNAAPNSAKAHLNYSVMVGARGNLEERLAANVRALELAPKWPMAHVYYGDTLCRLKRPAEAWPHYVRGFELAPNETNLIALGLQCLWDEKMLREGGELREPLQALVVAHPDTWLAHIGKNVLESGEAQNGVAPKYRPRGYNEGPKKE
jgi:tetratricopeptide (TPR) repeat protein